MAKKETVALKDFVEDKVDLESKIVNTDTDTRIKFAPWDPNWTNIVLSMIKDDEKVDRNPKVDGLRRAAWNIFDTVVSDTEIVQPPSSSNGGRAVVNVRVSAKIPNSPHTIHSCGAADVFSGNCDGKFAVHASAVAETRAEGRALRKLLCLTKVLAAEELYIAKDNDENLIETPAPSSMISALNMMCSKVKVNPLKLSNYYKIYIDRIEDLTKTEVLYLSKELSNLNVNKDKNPIPESILA
jgi:hypothetical protein